MGNQRPPLEYSELVNGLGELRAAQLLNALEASCFADIVLTHKEKPKQVRLDIVLNHIYRIADDDSADIFEAMLRA